MARSLVCALLLPVVVLGLKPPSLCRRAVLGEVSAAAAVAVAAPRVARAEGLAHADATGGTGAEPPVDAATFRAARDRGREKKGSYRLRSATNWQDGEDAGIEPAFRKRAAVAEVPVVARAAPAPEPAVAAPEPAAAEPGLPADWVEVVDPATGRTFYGNTASGAVQWDRPT